MTHNFVKYRHRNDIAWEREVICSICGLRAFESYRDDGTFVLLTEANGYKNPNDVTNVSCDEFIIKKIIE